MFVCVGRRAGDASIQVARRSSLQLPRAAGDRRRRGRPVSLDVTCITHVSLMMRQIQRRFLSMIGMSLTSNSITSVGFAGRR